MTNAKINLRAELGSFISGLAELNNRTMTPARRYAGSGEKSDRLCFLLIRDAFVVIRQFLDLLRGVPIHCVREPDVLIQASSGAVE